MQKLLLWSFPSSPMLTPHTGASTFRPPRYTVWHAYVKEEDVEDGEGVRNVTSDIVFPPHVNLVCRLERLRAVSCRREILLLSFAAQVDFVADLRGRDKQQAERDDE